jgi:DNA-binding response OmpR family regulator
VKKILVADDDRVMRELLGRILSQAGYETVFAVDGNDAVEKALAEKPDLVIMDGLMPKMHGFLACKTIKELENPPKVLLLTGIYTKPTYKWEVKSEYGADELLSKPFDKASLLAAIKSQLSDLDRSRGLSELQTHLESDLAVKSPSQDSEDGNSISRTKVEHRSVGKNAR